MEPEGIILVNSPITTFQQSLTHSAVWQKASKRPSTVVRSKTYSALSRNQYFHNLSAHGGVAKKWQVLARGRVGQDTLKYDDVIYEQLLKLTSVLLEATDGMER